MEQKVAKIDYIVLQSNVMSTLQILCEVNGICEQSMIFNLPLFCLFVRNTVIGSVPDK